MPFILLAGLALAPVSGCAFGPKALERSHGRYNESVRHVYEEELLRNIVRMRYNEAPLALDVSSIAAQYELAGQVEARPFFLAPNPSNSNIIFRTFTSILPDAMVSAANRPTMTMVPVNDSDSVREFLSPIPRETFVFLIQTGWPPSSLTRLWVERLNGVPNGSPAAGPPRTTGHDFARFQHLTELLQATADRELVSMHAEERLIPAGGPLPADSVSAAALVEAAKSGLEYRPAEGGKSWTLLRKERRVILEVSPEAAAAPEWRELMDLLNLVPNLPRYDVITASGVPDPQRRPEPPSEVVRMTLRSTAQVYAYLANGVEVPPAHLSCGIVTPTVDAEGQPLDSRAITRGLFEVHVCKGHKPPRCAFVAVPYRGYWFYIDDRDEASKATLALMLQLSRLDFGRGPRTGPVLTLPVSR